MALSVKFLLEFHKNLLYISFYKRQVIACRFLFLKLKNLFLVLFNNVYLHKLNLNLLSSC